MSESDLNELYTELKNIRTYLVKIGPARRKGEIIIKKIKEADDLVFKFNSVLESLNRLSDKFKVNESLRIEKISTDFFGLYESIIDLCSSSFSGKITENMAKFDLKIAMNLLPVASDDEVSIKQLIDGIEYYMLELDTDSRKKLIHFVLKNRLSQNAKLKLETNYDSIDGLIRAMKCNLLPKKSAPAIQTRLNNFKQNNLSVEEYGRQITNMFVDLTISQSEGNESDFKVLKPRNEKQAIKIFADGLRNRRLGTIVTARNYSSLNDAVQAALDEDSSAYPSEDILTLRYQNYNQYYHYKGRRNMSAGQFRGQRGRGKQYQYQAQYLPFRGRNAERGSRRGHFRAASRPRINRGMSFHNNFNRRNQRSDKQQAMHILTNSNDTNCNSDNPNEFFRD